MTKILVDKVVLEQALEALEADNSKLWPSDRRTAAYFNLRAALAEPQEPVAWVWNPVSEAWERVRAFGQWQCGAIYAFGPTAPAALAEPVQEPDAGEYHGWVLREVLFEKGEPVGHREPVQEPVYWEVRCTAHPKWMRVDEQQFDEYVAHGWEGQKLYTAPSQLGKGVEK